MPAAVEAEVGFMTSLPLLRSQTRTAHLHGLHMVGRENCGGAGWTWGMARRSGAGHGGEGVVRLSRRGSVSEGLC